MREETHLRPSLDSRFRGNDTQLSEIYRFGLSLFLISLFLSLQSAEGKTLHVKTDGNPAGDGLSWATAFDTVGGAITASASGDQIWVASGTYNESIQMKERVSLIGGFVGMSTAESPESRDWRRNETILDASGLNDRVVVGADRTILDGFTITGGRREYNPLVIGGSGMSCYNITMTIRNCYFHHNGEFGGPGRPQPANGGGLFSLDSILTFERCVFLDNIATAGGAVFVNKLDIGTTMFVNTCVFDRNSEPAYASFGGNNTLVNCTFGNFNGQNPNSDLTGGDSYHLKNCIVRNLELGGIPPDWEYNNIPGLGGINNNIDADPLFFDPENGDYRLQLGSPCIDAGTKVEILTDLDGNPRPVDLVGRGHEGDTSFDMGCYEFQLSPADLNANGSVDAEDLLLFRERWHEGE